MEWDDLRLFLQVARSGQMQAAAQALGVDHSTVSRRLSRLEERMGLVLFERAARRIKITEEGLKLFAATERIESIVLRDVMQICEQEVDLAGRVRIGTSEGFGSAYLASRLPQLTVAHPGLEIELVAVPRNYSLAAREVDIAITMEEPRVGSSRYKKLTDYRLGIYAAEEYFDSRARPQSIDDLREHPWCGYIDEMLYTPELDLLQFGDVRIRANYRALGVSSHLEAVCTGTMLGILPCYIARKRAGLERILQDKVALDRTYWLAVHEDLANSNRVRFLMQKIEEWVKEDRNIFRLDS
ncbi:LysR family transcriptional regulator [Paroceanicella profunda]|uniref:LysR family transcriptional regulator n=1 Tax=Paroceanicella profunda TaxID=2579971 RepID=A0A5B8G2E9_9RHOB|nr:LysR family transcriptional regulator [Paroceanicella profunda]QDL93322.1 LysR family transcriptional regulator [Paroceanicella profunda]